MYGKIFDSIYDGSLAESWEALVTFQQFIVLCDSAGIVDMTLDSLHHRTRIPKDILAAGIEYLERPDAGSRSSECEGRRLERLDHHREWGWRIVNHAKYRRMVGAADKRGADRDRLAAKRKADKQAKKGGCRKVSQSVAGVADVAHTDTDTYTETKMSAAHSVDPDGSPPPQKEETKDDLSFPQRCENFVLLWNQTPGVAKILRGSLSMGRKKRLKTRLQDPTWAGDFKTAVTTKFPLPCFEDRERNWKPDADWILRPDSVASILEGGKYDWTHENPHKAGSEAHSVRERENRDRDRNALRKRQRDLKRICDEDEKNKVGSLFPDLSRQLVSPVEEHDSEEIRVELQVFLDEERTADD